MTRELDPEVGQWYLRHDTGQAFRVVAIDAATQSVEIQSFEGDLEEVDLEVWREIEIEAVAAPEDWTGPYDELPAADLKDSPAEVDPRDWRISLERQVPPHALRDSCVIDDLEAIVDGLDHGAATSEARKL